MSVIFVVDTMIAFVFETYEAACKCLIYEPTRLDVTVLSGERFLGKIPFGRFSPIDTVTLYRNQFMLMRSESAA
ncbi:MAG: hypothetical protein V3S46_05370 [Nitrospinota bacterium]